MGGMAEGKEELRSARRRSWTSIRRGDQELITARDSSSLRQGFSSETSTAVAWAHFIAGDLFVGRYEIGLD